jgi:serine phosphatase RsbU (regulator of sigma subunit)
VSQAVAAYTPAVASPPPETAEDMARQSTTATSETTNAEVIALFAEDPDLDAVVVVEQDRPVGLINRNALFDRFARPFHREIFLRRSCTVFMDRAPVMINAATSLGEIAAQVAQGGEKGLSNGFLITKAGRLFGHCDGLSLLRVLSDLQEEQHRQLLSSIDYAYSIQKALLADSRQVLERRFPGRHAIDWQPRDVVGGDCFFAVDDEEGALVGLIDCTGHGVPGALLTSIALSELNRLTADPHLRRTPAALMSGLNRRVKAALQQAEDVDGEADEGMDAVFAWIPDAGAEATVASAKLPIAIIDSNGHISAIKGDRRGVGYRATDIDCEWTSHTVPMAPGFRLALATDGVCDQIGGDRDIAFGWSRFYAAVADAASGSPVDMAAAGRRGLEQWQGDQRRRDDITILTIDLDGRPA